MKWNIWTPTQCILWGTLYISVSLDVHRGPLNKYHIWSHQLLSADFSQLATGKKEKEKNIFGAVIITIVTASWLSFSDTLSTSETIQCQWFNNYEQKFRRMWEQVAVLWHLPEGIHQKVSVKMASLHIIFWTMYKEVY